MLECSGSNLPLISYDQAVGWNRYPPGVPVVLPSMSLNNVEIEKFVLVKSSLINFLLLLFLTETITLESQNFSLHMKQHLKTKY